MQATALLARDVVAWQATMTRLDAAETLPGTRSVNVVAARGGEPSLTVIVRTAGGAAGRPLAAVG